MAYFYRLLCLCLASFFFVHFCAGVIAKLLGNAAIRATDGMSARSAAHVLLAVRFFPVGLAGVIVFALCVPSYMLFEPHGIVEPVAPLCVAAAFIAMVLWGMSLYRGLRGLVSSFRCCRRVLPEVPGPVLALAGIWRSKLVISPEVLANLSPEELQSAICHERAHQLSRDNLKRLLILLAPGILPFWNGFSSVERAWAKFSEWAADDYAAGQDPERSLSLAAALVHVARLGKAFTPAPVMTSFLAGGSDLSERVERLLRNEARPMRRMNFATPAVAIASIALALLVAVQTATLEAAHQILEHLIH